MTNTSYPINTLLVWQPKNVGKPNEKEGDVYMCLKKTKKGDRAVVYESGSDGRGIFFIIDYNSGVYKSYDGVNTSYGMMTYLPKNITHTELCKNEKLKKVFQFPRGKRSLDKDVSDELNKIISNLPDFQKMDVPEDIEEIIANVWYPYKEKHKKDWIDEKEMQNAIVKKRKCYKQLGFTKRPDKEITIGDGSRRVDILGDKIVVECKIHADLNTLKQLEEYIQILNKEKSTNYKGHIVAKYITPMSLHEVWKHPDIRIWECNSSIFNRAILKEIIQKKK
ncbi:MAG: DUF91 domain-containing protein [Spirochaetes bacterium]|nr:DUF91 domain-containing protein [Spirochaetota bacterium]